MRKLIFLTIVAVLAVTASAGAATERQLHPSAGYITAGGGWTSFASGDPQQRFAGRGGAFAPLREVGYGFELGTDRRGRAVGVYGRCSGDGSARSGYCEVREARLDGAGDRLLLQLTRPYSHFLADEHRGVLALTRVAPSGASTTIDVRAAGRRTLRWKQTGWVTRIDIDTGRLVTLSAPDGTIQSVQAVDVSGRRPRTRELVTYADQDCRCSSSATFLNDAVINGRYAYWLETTTTTRGGEPVGGGYPADTVSRVFRVDLAARRPVKQVVDLPRLASELDVDRSRLLYVSGAGLFELTAVTWKRA